MNVVIREKYINGILWVFLGKTSDVMPDYAEKIFFPDYWHPFQGFFPDEQDRLFVLTHEPGANQGEFYLIFSTKRAFSSPGGASTFGRLSHALEIVV